MDDLDNPVGWPVGVRLIGGQQRPVNAIPGHQFSSLRGQGLRFSGRNALGFSLRQ